MKQHILSLTLLLSPLAANAEDVRLTLEQPIDFENIDDCKEAVEILELMYRRYNAEPLAICETTKPSGIVPHSPPETEDGADLSDTTPDAPSSPTSEPLPWERSA